MVIKYVYNNLSFNVICWKSKPISGQVDRASATETVDSGSFSGRVKPKTLKKLVFTAFLLDIQQLKGQYQASTAGGRQVGTGQVAAWPENRKVPSLSPGKGNLMNKM